MVQMVKRFIIMDQKDNTATALETILEGEVIQIDDKIRVVIQREIPFGHKFALADINQGDYIIKYGEIIGKAKKEIKAGDWVHTRNVRSAYMEGMKK